MGDMADLTRENTEVEHSKKTLCISCDKETEERGTICKACMEIIRHEADMEMFDEIDRLELEERMNLEN